MTTRRKCQEDGSFDNQRVPRSDRGQYQGGGSFDNQCLGAVLFTSVQGKIPMIGDSGSAGTALMDPRDLSLCPKLTTVNSFMIGE